MFRVSYRLKRKGALLTFASRANNLLGLLMKGTEFPACPETAKPRAHVDAPPQETLLPQAFPASFDVMPRSWGNVRVAETGELPGRFRADRSHVRGHATTDFLAPDILNRCGRAVPPGGSRSRKDPTDKWWILSLTIFFGLVLASMISSIALVVIWRSHARPRLAEGGQIAPSVSSFATKSAPQPLSRARPTLAASPRQVAFP